MKTIFSFAQFKFDVWLIEQLQMTPPPGPTLEDLRDRWLAMPGHIGILSRDMLTTHRKAIKDFLGIVISAPDRMHYRIMNKESLALDSLANNLLKSLQDYSFLLQYKDLGQQIQPEQIETGSRYLRLIGQALRDKQKLLITYQKFSDENPYDAIVHPYCLKADKGRWYILAYKEGSECQEPAQCFALDRTLRLTLLPETFVPNRRIKVATYFRDCFGIWRDYEHYPVRRFVITCTDKVAHYLRTLPLHHSQKEIRCKEEGYASFRYRISPSPDFIAELRKWGDEVKMEG